MVETERQIERRVAEPRAFGVEKDGSLGADQDVLRAHVAMDEREPGRERVARQCHQRCFEGGVGARGRFQIRLEANGMKHGVVGEPLRNRSRVRGGRVDRGDDPADARRERLVDLSLRELGLPHRKIGGIEELHRECPGHRIVSEDVRYDIGGNGCRRLHPGDFAGVAGHRCGPFLRDAELGKRTLDDENAIVRLDLPNVGSNAARHRGQARRAVRGHQSRLAQERDDRRLWIHRDRRRRERPVAPVRGGDYRPSLRELERRLYRR